MQAAVKPGSEQVAMGLYDLEHMELLRDPMTGTKCLVAWGPTTCVVAFRGTANKQNARHNAKVHQRCTTLSRSVRACLIKQELRVVLHRGWAGVRVGEESFAGM